MTRLTEIERTFGGLEAGQPDACWTKDDLPFGLAFERPETIASQVRAGIGYSAYRGVVDDPSVLLAGLARRSGGRCVAADRSSIGTDRVTTVRTGSDSGSRHGAVCVAVRCADTR